MELKRLRRSSNAGGSEGTLELFSVSTEHAESTPDLKLEEALTHSSGVLTCRHQVDILLPVRTWKAGVLC